MKRPHSLRLRPQAGPLVGALAVTVLMITASCQSVVGPARMSHDGIRYTIAQDQRFSRIEKGKSGSFLYDSPELTVLVDQGRLKINGQDAGPVQKGDHVEVNDMLQVTVNGKERGNVTTGYSENQQRIQQSKLEIRR